MINIKQTDMSKVNDGEVNANKLRELCDEFAARGTRCWAFMHAERITGAIM